MKGQLDAHGSNMGTSSKPLTINRLIRVSHESVPQCAFFCSCLSVRFVQGTRLTSYKPRRLSSRTRPSAILQCPAADLLAPRSRPRDIRTPATRSVHPMPATLPRSADPPAARQAETIHISPSAQTRPPVLG